MSLIETKIEIFKPYLMGNRGYSGGKTLNEVESNTDTIFKLSSNENLLGTSPKAMEAIRSAATDLNQYPDRTTQRMQSALADHYKGQLDPGHFIACNSGSEVIEHVIRAFLGEGLECIVSNPCFMPYVMFSQWQGAKVVDVRLKDPDYQLDVDGILEAVNERTRLVFLTTPNNPTGTHLPKADIDRLLAGLPDHVITVIDEVYFHFADAPDYIRALPYVQAGKPVIAVNSFSKTYGLAAMRIGYGYAPLEIADYVRKLSKPFLLNKLSQEAAMAALEDDAFVRRTVELVQTERVRLYKELDRLGITYWKSQANFIMIRPAMDDSLFEEKMLSEGVMVRKVASFGAPGCVRVTIGTKEANDAWIHAMEKTFG